MSVHQGIHFSNKNECDFKWGEVTGNNYDMIKTELQELSLQMENIAINFSTENETIKTATQAEKESTEDESKLTDRATQLEDALNNAIEDLGKLKDGFETTDQTVTVNKDFSSNTLTEQQTLELRNLRLDGVISKERLVDLLVKGEVLNFLDDQAQAKEDTFLLNDNMGGDEGED